MIGLEIVPLLFFSIGALCCWIVAWPGGIALRALASAQRWSGEPDLQAARRAVFWALMAHLAVAAAMDALTGTRHSLMAALPVLNQSQCFPECYSWTPPEQFKPAIQTMDDYYRTVIGAGSTVWLKYLLWQLPGAVAALAALVALNPWREAGQRSLAGLMLVTVLSIGLLLAFGMTIAVNAMLTVTG